MTTIDPEMAHDEAYDEGYDKGRLDGRKRLKVEIEEYVRKMYPKEWDFVKDLLQEVEE